MPRRKKSKAGYPITEWRVREQINKANYRSAPLHVSHASPLRCAACNVRLDRPRYRRRRRRRFHVAGERVRLFRGDRRSNFHALQRRTVQGLFLDCGQAVTRIRARFPVSKSSSVVVDRPPSCIGIIEEAGFVEGEEGEQRVTNVSTPLVRRYDRYLFRGKLIDDDP